MSGIFAFIRTLPSDSRAMPRLIHLQLEGFEDRLVPAPMAATANPLHPIPVASRSPHTFQPEYVIDNHGELTTNVRSLSDFTGDIPGYEPTQLRTAYGINALLTGGTAGTGAGQTIAIVDAYNDPNIVFDVDIFDQQFGASSASSQTLYQQFGAATSFLHVFNEKGLAVNPSHAKVPIDKSGGWEFEESLDVEWAHAIAPGATIDLIEANRPTDKDLFAAVKAAANLPGVSVVSMSFSGGESSDELADDGAFTTPAGHQGVTFLASTGDESTGGYPAFSPNVIAVGGTTLTLKSDYTIQSETGWSTLSDLAALAPVWGTGGGASALEAEPNFQLGVQQSGFRSAPDVAFDADPLTGVAVFDSFRNSSLWTEVGGTSLSSPSFAGVLAIANQARVTKGLGTLNTTNPQQTATALYGVPGTDFHDITAGQIYTGTDFFGPLTGPTYSAGPNYDMVSGMGTPSATLLVPDLAAFAGAAAPLDGTSISLTESNEFPSLGSSVSITATVSAASGSASVPTGTVSFYAVPLFGGNDIPLGTFNLPNDGTGQVTLTTSSVPVGDYSVFAFYGGDANFATSNKQDVLFVDPIVTTISLTPSAPAAKVGDPVTFTATVSPATLPFGVSAPTGYVSFYDGKTLLGVVALPTDGSDQVSIDITSLRVGHHTIKAVYSGDINFFANTTSIKERITKNNP
jgi:subtilase family serine protease